MRYLVKAGPYIGPRGGKWADPKHTIPWKGGQLALDFDRPAQAKKQRRKKPTKVEAGERSLLITQRELTKLRTEMKAVLGQYQKDWKRRDELLPRTDRDKRKNEAGRIEYMKLAEPIRELNARLEQRIEQLTHPDDFDDKGKQRLGLLKKEFRKLREHTGKIYPTSHVLMAGDADRFGYPPLNPGQRFPEPYGFEVGSRQAAKDYRNQFNRIARELESAVANRLGSVRVWEDDEIYERSGVKYRIAKEGRGTATGLFARRRERFLSMVDRAHDQLRKIGLGDVLNGLTVNIVSRSFLPKDEHGASDAAGWYRYSTDELTLYDSALREREDRRGVHGTLFHELGHRVLLRLASGNARALWMDQGNPKQKIAKVDTDRFIDRFTGGKRLEDFESKANLMAELAQGAHTSTRKGASAEHDGVARFILAELEDPKFRTKLKKRLGPMDDKPEPEQFRKALAAALKGAEAEVEHITEYGRKNMDERFAEAFERYINEGPRALPPQTRAAFERTLEAGGMRLRKSLSKSGDWLAFTAFRELGFSEEEADRLAGAGVDPASVMARMEAGIPSLQSSQGPSVGQPAGGRPIARMSPEVRKRALELLLEPGGHVSAARPAGSEPVSPPAAAMRETTPGELKAALEYERAHGEGDAQAKAQKVQEHVRERPSYYVELGAMMDPDNGPVFRRALTPGELIKAAQGGWERGPRGGMRRRLPSGKWQYRGQSAKEFAELQEQRKQRFKEAQPEKGPKGKLAPEDKPPKKPINGQKGGQEGTYGQQKPGEPAVDAQGQPLDIGPDPYEDHPDAPHDSHQTTEGIDLVDAINHLHEVDPKDLKARGELIVAEVRRKDPEAAKRLEQELVHLEHVLRRGAAAKKNGAPAEEKGKNGKRRLSKDDMDAAEALKKIMRDFNQAAAPASILGPELGGILAPEKKGQEQDASAKEAQKEARKGEAKPEQKDEQKPEEAKKAHYVTVDRLLKGGPYYGPKGGKWADPKHTIPWKDRKKKPRQTTLDFDNPRPMKAQDGLKDLKIKRIVSIVDTRERELVEGTLGREYSRPIPGSGTASDCARCGKEHEVHATVELSDGSQRVMGTGCAKQVDPELKARIGSLERATKTVGKVAHELAGIRHKLEKQKQTNAQAEAEVDALAPPPIEETRKTFAGKEVRVLQMGGAKAWLQEWHDEERRRAEMPFLWRQHELKTRGWGTTYQLESQERDAERRLARAERRRTQLLEVKKAGPYGPGSWGPVPTIAPIAGSSPREETPSLPDYQEIYYQPPSDRRKKLEEAQELTRRKVTAQRNAGVYGFHGTGLPKKEPVLHYITTEESHTGPKLSARKPIVEAKDSEPQRLAGDPTYGPEKGGAPVNRKTDRGRAPRSSDRRDDPVPTVNGRPTPRDEADDIKRAPGRDKPMGLYAKMAARGGKYLKRVPYTDAKGKRRYRYYYRESAVAREAQAGEEVKLGKRKLTVEEVGEDGSVTIAIEGKRRTLSHEQYSQLLARHYGRRFYDHAEKRARQALNAVYKHVPKSLLSELKGGTLEERLADLRKRAPKVHKRLESSFQRAGVRPRTARRVVEGALQARGWTEDARAAAIGSVLERRTGAESFHEVLRGAENLAGGAQVELKHVGAVVELRNPPERSFEAEVAEVAQRAEQELARLSKALAAAQKGDQGAAAEAMAQALASTAIQKLNLLTQAFPGLKDKAAEQARETALEVPGLTQGPPKKTGAETVVFVAGENGQPKALKARYELREASEVVASHDPLKGFKAREDYPEGVQERAYHRDQSEQGKVLRNAQKLRPEFLINTNPDAVNGPPLVTSDGHALGGNSRTMSMQVAYERHPEVADSLKSYLAEHAHEVGFRSEDVKALKRPVLVRVVDDPTSEGPSMFGDTKRKHTPDEMKLLVRQMNESFTQAMDPRTMQVAMGRKLDEQTLSTLANTMEEGESLAQFLASSRSEPFVNNLMRVGVIDQRNANQYVTKGTKRLNEDGRTLVSRILVGRLVGNADVLSETRPSTVDSVARATPHMLAAKAHGEGYDLSEDMGVALEAFNDLQRLAATGKAHFGSSLDPKMSDQDFQGLFRQQALFGDEPEVTKNPRAMTLLEVLIRRPGPQQMAAVFKDYAAEASKYPEGQATMFGAPPPPAQVLEQAVRRAIK